MNQLKNFIAKLNSLDITDDYLVSELYDLIEPIEDHPELKSITQDIFIFIENSPEADLGSPGPLVHLLETIDNCREMLHESIKRKPVSLTVWMLNRWLNLQVEQREKELTLLKSVLGHSKADEETKERAQGYLERHKDA